MIEINERVKIDKAGEAERLIQKEKKLEELREKKKYDELKRLEALEEKKVQREKKKDEGRSFGGGKMVAEVHR